MIDSAPHVKKLRRRRLVVYSLLLTSYLLVAMFGGCADSLLLYPTTETIDTNGAERAEIAIPSGACVEVYSRRANGDLGTEPAAYLLILDGNGGRAERAVTWGDQVTAGHPVEIWAMNYCGYGRSPGKATLAAIPPAALAAYDALKQKAGDRPIVIWGTSMGSTAALYVAANRPVSGLVLTNPPPLRQLILGKYGWWNLWLAAFPVSRGIPAELDSIANAAKVTCPMVVATAANDTIVPPEYQQQVIDAYAGPKHLVNLPDADHNTPAVYSNPTGWEAGLEWLWAQVGVGNE